MKTTITSAILGLLAAAASSACQYGASDQGVAQESVAPDTLAYTYTDYTLYSKNVIKTGETTDTTFFAASYPEFADSSINSFVRSSLLGNDTATVEGTAKTFIDEFDDFHRSDPFPRIWTSESRAKVYRITPTYLSLAIDVYSFTGGAHGNYATVFAHYDMERGETLILDDIVAPAFRNELTAVAERYFRQQENLGVDQAFGDRYFFDDDRFRITDNFALERDSLLLLYNIYDIKPYVDGQTELRVPLSELDRLLSDRAKRIVAQLPN